MISPPTFRPRWVQGDAAEKRRYYDRLRKDTPWRRFINSTPWRRLSKHYLNLNPICVHCAARGEDRPATQVHHTRGQDAEFAFDESTFEALCQSCHSRITASET